MSTMTLNKGKNSQKVPPKEREIPFGHLAEEYHDSGIARTAIRFGGLAVLVFFLWAAFSPVHEVATGQGSIIPSGFVNKLNHLEGGIVAQVVAREGQTVREGDPLIILDDANVRAELIKAQAREEGVRQAIERQAIFSDRPSSVFEGEVKLRGIVDRQQTATEVDDQFRTAQLEVVRAEIALREAELSGLGNQLTKTEEEYTLLQAQLNDYEVALKSGAVSRKERDGIAREVIRLAAQVESLQDQQTAGRAQITAAKARENELQARFMQDATSALAELEVQQIEAQELVGQLTQRLAETVIRATEDGTLHNLGVRNAGEAVTPGQLVAEIVPAFRAVFAEVNIPADKIGFVTEGTNAKVKVLTYDFSRFGALEGVISDVSPSSFTRDDGSSFYRVRIRLDEQFVGDASSQRQVLPGMSVVADIRLGEKSVLSYLLKPLRAVSDRALSEK